MPKVKAHPYADLFPMMDAEELEALAEDIRENGLRHPIITYQGQILDGRNRLKACEKAGVEPTFSDYDGDDPLGLVISLNVQRRDLTAAQRAIAAARCMDHTQKLSRNGRKAVAAKFKVGEVSIQQAKALLTDAPDLAEQVELRTTSLAAAYEEHQKRQRLKEQREKDAKKVADFKEAISNGEVSLEDALQKVLDSEREERERYEAMAHGRKTWFKGLSECLSWIEESVGQRTDEHLAWYTDPDTPGEIDNSINAGRLECVIEQLERVRVITFGGKQ